jgi:hypothetical protein
MLYAGGLARTVKAIEHYFLVKKLGDALVNLQTGPSKHMRFVNKFWFIFILCVLLPPSVCVLLPPFARRWSCFYFLRYWYSHRTPFGYGIRDVGSGAA